MQNDFKNPPACLKYVLFLTAQLRRPRVHRPRLATVAIVYAKKRKHLLFGIFILFGLLRRMSTFFLVRSNVILLTRTHEYVTSLTFVPYFSVRAIGTQFLFFAFSSRSLTNCMNDQVHNTVWTAYKNHIGPTALDSHRRSILITLYWP